MASSQIYLFALVSLSVSVSIFVSFVNAPFLLFPSNLKY